MATPSRRKRLVIEDSSSSESSFCVEEDQDAESTFSSDDSVRVVNNKTTSGGVQSIMEPMKTITLSSDESENEDEFIVDSDDEILEIESDGSASRKEDDTKRDQTNHENQTSPTSNIQKCYLGLGDRWPLGGCRTWEFVQ